MRRFFLRKEKWGGGGLGLVSSHQVIKVTKIKPVPVSDTFPSPHSRSTSQTLPKTPRSLLLSYGFASTWTCRPRRSYHPLPWHGALKLCRNEQDIPCTFLWRTVCSKMIAPTCERVNKVYVSRYICIATSHHAA